MEARNKKTKLERCNNFNKIKEFNIPIRDSVKKINLSIEELEKYL